jgi:predicted nucleic acid-binding protein
LNRGHRRQFDDTLALRFIAALAKEQKIRLLIHQEVIFELMGLPRANGGQRFYDAPIEEIDGPFQYSRIAFDHTKHDYQYEFLSKVDHPRFKELQRACGAYQGEHKPLNRNQLLDAFHVLCAESASADYFVTMDGALARVLQDGYEKKTTVNLVAPKELLIALLTRRPTWFWSIWKERKRLLKSGRQLDAYTQDASEEFFKGKAK